MSVTRLGRGVVLEEVERLMVLCELPTGLNLADESIAFKATLGVHRDRIVIHRRRLAGSAGKSTLESHRMPVSAPVMGLTLEIE